VLEIIFAMHHARVLVTQAGWLLLIEFLKEIFL